MSAPKQEFLRRSQVVNWLEEDHELTPWQTRQLIEEKVIIGKPLKEWFAESPSCRARGTTAHQVKKNGHRRKGDLGNYYRKSQIKAALKI